ncbi:S9 family peptidase [Marinibactrum halimedae]|uniref:Acyl-peptide hydrolase n=1 Tax=Marinibactrum halimedae TaxID=1444977 RepID=A0AA37T0W3_9GAMM|nr:S9 family peptidase [Marinibactrum halimedae]MCD9457756.1 S9 family peptidase [Marinibactrum halimedae]GLS24870.1 acyl-peptide hydrolase [Marinibactrum halimedae]
MKKIGILALGCLSAMAFASDKGASDTEKDNTLHLNDVFSLEYASGVEIDNSGKTTYFVRHYMDIHSDKKAGNIWKVDEKGGMRPVTNGLHNDFSPLLSPNGDRLAYISTASGKPQIHIKWLNTGEETQITHLTSSPGNLAWSPDGNRIAFTQYVKGASKSPVALPGKPEGAKWAKPAKFIDDLYYRADGAGYLTAGNTQVFVVPADGGAARQITEGEFDHGGKLSWSKNGKSIFFSANRHEKHELEPLNSEIYRVDVNTGELTMLTDRFGPDASPVVSPDGKWVAYLGFDDTFKNYESTNLYLMKPDGSGKKSLTDDFDRKIDAIQWAGNGKGLYILYKDKGDSKLDYQPIKGKRKTVVEHMGGTAFGRPYTDADFDVSNNGVVAYTHSDVLRPADVAVNKNGKTRVLTQLNEDALAHKALGKVEEIWVKSSADNRDIQGWLVYPANYEEGKKYPLILEIHGGPVASYGPHFSTEIQLMAAKGYAVLYMNPRGSDSYGTEFAQTIHHNYPSQDYDDLMSGVDAVLKKGFINENELFVTGGSGGGTLTAWIVGHTDRFAAAVVAKPVINWYSFVLTADYYPFFYKYWFGKKPWEDIEHYMKHSPIQYAGNVTTPTMLLTGEADYRTPISETEQFYQALKINEVETAMVRIPDSSHGIYRRPSNLMSKVAHILWWFDQYKESSEEDTTEKK